MYRYIKASSDSENTSLTLQFANFKGIPSRSLDHFFKDKSKQTYVEEELANMYGASGEEILETVNYFIDNRYVKDPEKFAPRIQGKQLNSGYESIITDRPNFKVLESHSGARIFIRWD